MKDVSLRQLRFLTEVVRTGSLAGAAERLHLTGPAIAQQLRLLEKSVGLALLERGPGGQRPTEAGRLLVDTAARVETELAVCEEALSSLRSADAGHVTLGAVSTAKYFSPQVLASFRASHPGIRLALRIGNRDEVLARLEEHDIDLAVMGRPPEGLDVEQEVFGAHPYVVIAPPGHPLVGRRSIPFAEVAVETFLVRERGAGTRLALISAHTIAAEVHDGRLAVLDVQGLPIRRHWLVVRLRRRAISPATRALWDFVVAEAGRQLPVLSPKP
jgi:DNA-binding transcriptional LysR family regulator